MPKLTAYQKYQNFIALNPKYKTMGPTKICSIMLEQQYLTPDEVKELKNNLLIFNYYEYSDRNNTDNTYNLMGLNISNKPIPAETIQTPYAQQYYHPLFKNILCDEKGKINLEQFSLKALKEKYNAKDYNVTQNEEDIMIETKTGFPVLSIRKSPWFKDELEVVIYDDNKMSDLTLRNGEIDRLTTSILENNKITIKEYNNSLKLTQEIINYKNGDRENISYNAKTGEIKFKDYWKKDGNIPQKNIEYTNGKPWKQRIENEVQYPLVDDLINGLEAKSIIGSPTTGPNLYADILNRIDSSNIEVIFNEFENRTGEKLTDRLNREYSMSSKQRETCIEHLEKLYTKHTKPQESGEYLGEKLYNDINGTDKSLLSKHIRMINEDNLKYVMVKYRKISFQETSNDSDEFYYTMNTIKDYLPDVLCTKIAEYKITKLTKYHGLLDGIIKSNLNQEEKNNLIQHIITTAMEEKNEYAKKQAEKDIASHPNEMQKVEVDIYRLENSIKGEYRNPNLGKDSTISESFLSTTTKQGQMADCWLIAGINSIIAKPKMLEQLEKLITFNEETQSYTINLKGVDKKYTFNINELLEANHLSNGSIKMRVVEMAIDQNLKEIAYNDSEPYYDIDEDFGHISGVDINGGFTATLWLKLFGYNPQKTFNIDIKTEDFNNPETAYAFGITTKEDVSGLAYSNKNKNYTMVTRHAYSIIGSDAENVYIVNPWDSSDIITMTRENLAQIIDSNKIERYKIPTNE